MSKKSETTGDSSSRDSKSATSKSILKNPVPAPPPFKARAYTKPHFDTPLTLQRKKCDSAVTKISSSSPTPSSRTTQTSIAAILDSVFSNPQTSEPELTLKINNTDSEKKKNLISYNLDKASSTKYSQAFNKARNNKPAAVIKETKIVNDPASSALSSILVSLPHNQYEDDIIPPPQLTNFVIPMESSRSLLQTGQGMPKYSATIRNKIAARLASRKIFPRRHIPTEEELAAKVAFNEMSSLLNNLLTGTPIDEELDDEELLIPKEQKLLEFNKEDHRGSTISEINATDSSKTSFITPDKALRATTPNSIKNIFAKHSELAAKAYMQKKTEFFTTKNNKEISNVPANMTGPLEVKMSPNLVKSNNISPNKQQSSSVPKSTASTIAKMSTPQTTATALPNNKPQEALSSNTGENTKMEEKGQKQPKVVTTEMNTTPRVSRAVISFFINEFD